MSTTLFNPLSKEETAPPPHAPEPPLIGDPPHPTLQAAGFQYGGIQTFNQRVQAATDAYQQAHGSMPAPGLVFDVVRSKVQPDDYPKLFHPALTDSRTARAAGAVATHQASTPGDYFVTRPDGIIQPNNPMFQLISKTAPTPTAPTKEAPVEPQATFLKKYPMVEMGSLPIPDVDKVMTAISYLNAPTKAPTPPAGHQAPGDQAIQQYQYEQAQFQAGQRNEVTTLKGAQTELNKAMNTSFPVTGVFNQTWTTALANWMKTTSYAKQQLAFQASQDGFGKNTAAYVKAWNQKQRATKHGLTGWFLQAMPLGLFGHGSLWDDIASTPSYLKGSSNNPLNIGLHSLTRTAGLTMDTIGGTVTQAKADAAAGGTLAREMNVLGFGNKTYEQSLADARKQLHANPTWLRALSLGQTPVDEKGWLAKLDQATNVLGDLILLRKPGFTGERLAAGDLGAATKSTYLNVASKWAFNDLKTYGKDGIGRASARLESGQGARALVARTAVSVQRGDMQLGEFQQKVAELYAKGATTVKVGSKSVDVEGPLLDSLRTKNLPTPGVSGRAWLTAKTGMRKWLDNIDERGTLLGSTKAQDFAALLRVEFSHYVPSTVGYADKILPERVFNYVLKHKLTDAAGANRIESQLVRFQGTNNVRGIQAVQRKLEALYHEKYPIGDSAPKDDPFKALLATETPSVFHFPKGNEEEVVADTKTAGALASIQRNAKAVNKTLNRVALLHARVILSGLNPITGLGGFSLFWKHLVGDSLRVEAGGGGIITGLDPEVRAAKAEINALANSDADVSRTLGLFREKMKKGEANWALNRGGASLTRDFNTSDHLAQGNYMTGAGGYVRRMLDDPALEAYQSGGDALTQLVLHNRAYQALWKAAWKANPDMTAEDYAATISERYKNLANSLNAQGLNLDDLKAEYDTVRGAHADSDLGKWIAKNKVGLDVYKAQIQEIGSFDKITGDWVGNVIMAPNKMNRGRFAENVLAKTYAELKKAGWEPKPALQTAASVSESLTKFHMLDFANRLQVEQDMRWLSYFATKHRLYFKWVLSTFLRHPGYAAAVSDFSKTLDQYGGWKLPLHLFGQQWDVPLERLVWVPGQEYDETSPLALAVFNFIKSGGNLDAVVQGATGTGGNVITRSDTATVLGTKLLRIEMGANAASYGYAIKGLDTSTASKVTRAINEYQTTYFQQHGHYATEANAVKVVLLRETGLNYWSANLPLPIVPENNRTEQEQELADFMKIDDPKKRSQFLTSHPDLANSFGVYNNPAANIHNQPLFNRWSKALVAYHAGRTQLYDELKSGGKWTEAMELQRRDLNNALNRTRNQLLIDDAKQSGIDTQGLVPNGTTIPYGPWGKLVNKDPIFDITHTLSALFPHLEGATQGDVIGPLQKEMQSELAELNDSKYAASSGYTHDEVTTRRTELLQRLEVFNSYPTDALGSIRDSYQKLVNQYWKGYNTRYNAAALLPSSGQKQADANFRAWRDSQDHPVKVDGTTFPSPVRMAWATLDPTTRQQRLSYLSGKPLADLANYELDLLGVPHPPNVSAALAAINDAITTYHEQNPGKGLKKAQIVDIAKQVNRTPGYQGFFVYYVNSLTEPRVKQFEQTSVYRGMPAGVKSGFGEIAQAAISVTRQMKAGHTSYYEAQWRKAVAQQITPWLDNPANKQLKAYLAPMGANFLDTLVSSSTGV